MFWKNQNFLGNVLIGGTAGAFLLSVLLATVVFDKPSLNAESYVPEIELAMVANPGTSHSDCWMDYVFPLHITCDVSNVQKVDKKGVASAGSMIDLFPTNGPATGRGTLKCKIKIVERSQLPSFANMTLKMMPMFYIPQKHFPQLSKSLFKLTVLSVKNIGFISFVTVVWGFALILGGSYIVYKAKTRKTPVRKIIEPPVQLFKEIPRNSLLIPA